MALRPLALVLVSTLVFAQAGKDGGAKRPPKDAGAPQTTCPAPKSSDRSLYVWQTTTFTDDAAKASFFDFATSHGVKTVFLQVGSAHMPATGADTSALGKFIADAQSKCIGVELLVGEAKWSLADYHSIVVGLATTAKTFTTALTGAKPKAFHVDVEPHGVGGVVSGGVTYSWSNDGTNGTTNQRPAILNQFLDGLAKVKAALGSTLPLHVDVAFWLDGGTGFNPLQRVSGGANVGTPRPAHELVIDGVDRVHVMAYRDRAFGASCDAASCSANGIYDLSLAEVAYAAKVGKTAVIAVETTNAGSTVSFFEETVAVMDAEIAKVVNAHGATAAMRGVAVHDLVGYRALQAKTP